ncbi:hypothetical protein IRJ41_022844 [Triplophysa rosa]|uniref:Uncharacterized protein n=1 Tax=Triplophysa rosa TaxID=992332 RepID=A0A9W7T760_TRIRA|nr:hypothetical protein IRJ41_022844 [Triplophysa rosa]
MILKKYNFKKRIQETLAISRKQQKRSESSILTHKVKYRSLCYKLYNKVVPFLTRDENSRLTAGKSQTITRGKIKKQKRFLNDTMRNSYRKFLIESSNCNISYSLFCRMRPFWVVHPSIADRETCLCKECMYNECPNCKDKDFPVATDRDMQASVFITQWATETVLREKKNKEGKKEKVPVKMTVKKKTETTLHALLDLFQGQLKNFRRHLFNIKRQFVYHRELKKTMKDHVCLIHVDFSENYACKYHSEIQTLHFASNQQQAILHTGVLHIGGVEEHVCFGTISSSKEKGPAAIWTHLDPILNLVKAAYPNVTVLQEYGFQSGTWNFFEASHGKGAPDGVGGLLKRTADRLVSHGVHIPNAELFFKKLVDAQTSVKLFYVSEDDVDEATKNMPAGLPVVPSTIRIHQLVTVSRGQISYRDVSCLCSTRQTLECQCYNTKTFTFLVQATAPTQEGNGQNETEIPWQNLDIIGQWCALEYDNDIYPGIIQGVSETHVEVKCMHRIGVNRFFWPVRDDVLLYLHEDILRMIPIQLL